MRFTAYIKSLFSAPSAETLALRELEEARRQLLAAHSTQEYSAKMVEYHTGKIKRLTSFLKSSMKDQEAA